MELHFAACVEWSGRRRCWGRKADGIQNRDVQTGLEHGVSFPSRRWVLGARGREEEARPSQGPLSPLQEGVCRQGGSAGRGRDASLLLNLLFFQNQMSKRDFPSGPVVKDLAER